MEEQDKPKKLLFVLGAGASCSLNKSKASQETKVFPTGNQLINEIISYKHKALSDMLSYALFKLVANWDDSLTEDMHPDNKKYIESHPDAAEKYKLFNAFKERIKIYYSVFIQNANKTESEVPESDLHKVKELINEIEGSYRNEFNINAVFDDVFKDQLFRVNKNNNKELILDKIENLLFFELLDLYKHIHKIYFVSNAYNDTEHWKAEYEEHENKPTTQYWNNLKQYKNYKNYVYSTLYMQVKYIVNTINNLSAIGKIGYSFKAKKLVGVYDNREEELDLFIKALTTCNITDNTTIKSKTNIKQECLNFINRNSKNFGNLKSCVFLKDIINKLHSSITDKKLIEIMDEIYSLKSFHNEERSRDLGFKDGKFKKYGARTYNGKNHHWNLATCILDFLSPYLETNFFNLKIRQNNDCFVNNDIIKDLKQIYLACSVIEYYKPKSIDYFMTHITAVAPYEFTIFKTQNNDNTTDTNKEDIKKRRTTIEKYIKFIIADYLHNAGLNTIETNENNYINSIKWKIIEYTNFYYREKYNDKNNPEDFFNNYCLNNVNFINFNYDTSLESFIDQLFSNDISIKMIKNIQCMYGKATPKKATKYANHLIISKYSNIWSSIFTRYLEFEGGNEAMDNLSDNIKWIAENKEDKCLITEKKQDENTEEKQDENFFYCNCRKCCQERLNNADEIYFLGFGFDKFNLQKLGILNKQMELDLKSTPNKVKKIYISGATPKIVSLIQDIFNIPSFSKISSPNSNLYTIKSSPNSNLYTIKNSNYHIYLSTSYLPDCFDSDF